MSKWTDARLEDKLATVKRFWPLSHKSGLSLSLSLITVALDSTSTFLPQRRPLCHNCGLVRGLIFLALASVGYFGPRPQGRNQEGARPPLNPSALRHFFLSKIILQLRYWFFYLSNTVETGMVVASQWD